jgi:hypothetical protein
MTKPIGVTWDELRQIALTYPGVEEATSYGTPAFRLRKKGLVRMREDNETLVMPIDEFERDLLLQAEPDTFYITDHYAGYPYILIRLAKISPQHLRKLFEAAWRRAAATRQIADYDGKPSA